MELFGRLFEPHSPINGGQTNTYQPICSLHEAHDFLIVVDSAVLLFGMLGVYFVVEIA